MDGEVTPTRPAPAGTAVEQDQRVPAESRLPLWEPTEEDGLLEAAIVHAAGHADAEDEEDVFGHAEDPNF